MPLTEKGEKIKAAMTQQYGTEKGEQVFYASKNKGKITGVDETEIKMPYPGGEIERTYPDDYQHMGFTEGEAVKIKHLVSECDALEKRLDAFQKQQHQAKPKMVKPRTKDNMQPSNPHPKQLPK